MIAIDTNMLVRYLIKDDLGQAVLVINFMKKNKCFILKTVLLEVAWVLSSPGGYNLSRNVVHERLLHVLGLSCIEVEDAINVAQALNLYFKGMDFADALHVSGSIGLSGFATFDRKFASLANKMNVLPPVALIK
jgi:predicted nucleic-acid-binding protein